MDDRAGARARRRGGVRSARRPARRAPRGAAGRRRETARAGAGPAPADRRPRRQPDGGSGPLARPGVPGAAAAASGRRGARLRGRQRGRVGRHVGGRPAPSRLGARRRRARPRSWRSAATTGCAGCRRRSCGRTSSRIIERAQARRHRGRAGRAWKRRPTTARDYTSAFRQVYPRPRAGSTTWRSCRSCSRASPGTTTLNQPDGIHPTAEGARIVADNVWSVLQPIVEKRSGRS